jgi:hypothetical protein
VEIPWRFPEVHENLKPRLQLSLLDCLRGNIVLSVHYFALKLHDDVQLRAKVVTTKSCRLITNIGGVSSADFFSSHRW